MTLAIITFVSIFALVLSAVLLIYYRMTYTLRMSRVVSTRSGVSDPPHSRSLHSHVKQRAEGILESLERIVPRTPAESSNIARRLMLAGYRRPRHVKIFYGAKALMPVILCVTATLAALYEYNSFLVYTVAVTLGFLLPDWTLDYLIRKRKLELRLGLPDALDLMVVCVEAGLGIDQATKQIAEEMSISHKEIADEFSIVNLEQRAGKSRSEAWRNLAQRTGESTVRSLVAMLIQTEQFGTSLGESLRVHASSLRTQRRQEVEELAAKTTVKLVFPLVLFIFPSLFVVLLGPSMLTIKDSFQRLF